MKDYTLSIVIPCYNEKNSIRTIVDRVLESPIKNKEIIVVDDKSTDGTSEILDREIAPLVSKVIMRPGMRSSYRMRILNMTRWNIPLSSPLLSMMNVTYATGPASWGRPQKDIRQISWRTRA